ncbi:hypothetical protein IE077_003242, partial [Cardiosporidium cionae]
QSIELSRTQAKNQLHKKCTTPLVEKEGNKYSLKLFEEYSACADGTNKEWDGTTVCFFDLDDTLIPTEWIKRRQIHIKNNPNESQADPYLLLREEINRLTHHLLVQKICDIIYDAKKLTDTVAIVTNARSNRWLSVFKQMFPEVITLLDNEKIPILKSSPRGTEPGNQQAPEYFMYWMNAKACKHSLNRVLLTQKSKFKRVIEIHRKQIGSAKDTNLDIISIGDNDFEECAALDLVNKSPHAVRLAKIVRCKAGLNPTEFLSQLQMIQQAMHTIHKETLPKKKFHIGSYVTCHVHAANFSPESKQTFEENDSKMKTILLADLT